MAYQRRRRVNSVKLSIPALISGTAILLATPVFAQYSGASHPEELKDDIVVAAPQNSTVTVTTPAPAPALQPRVAAGRPTLKTRFPQARS
jgi:hypothetical protein